MLELRKRTIERASLVGLCQESLISRNSNCAAVQNEPLFFRAEKEPERLD